MLSDQTKHYRRFQICSIHIIQKNVYMTWEGPARYRGGILRQIFAQRQKGIRVEAVQAVFRRKHLGGGLRLVTDTL